eukprot:364684-Chlamydomonas_euryale.AAC.5
MTKKLIGQSSKKAEEYRASARCHYEARHTAWDRDSSAMPRVSIEECDQCSRPGTVLHGRVVYDPCGTFISPLAAQIHERSVRRDHPCPLPPRVGDPSPSMLRPGPQHYLRERRFVVSRWALIRRMGSCLRMLGPWKWGRDGAGSKSATAALQEEERMSGGDR